MKKILIVSIMFASLLVNVAAHAAITDAIPDGIKAYTALQASLKDAKVNLAIMKDKELKGSSAAIAKAKATVGMMIAVIDPLIDLMVVLQDISPAVGSISKDTQTKLEAVLKNVMVMLAKIKTGSELLKAVISTATEANVAPALAADPQAQQSMDDLSL
ncbi:MAG: hypothetical protein P4L31_03005 [Candidatus Babeliales bacterium]|nr:hypothetical protein [Candidatus Babeliales bacterium]